MGHQWVSTAEPVSDHKRVVHERPLGQDYTLKVVVGDPWGQQNYTMPMGESWDSTICSWTIHG